MSLHYQDKRKLAPFAAVFQQMESAIEEMGKAECERLLAACKKTTQTNCWWAEHKASTHLIPVIEGRLWRLNRAVDD